jgi:hypothetical protein
VHLRPTSPSLSQDPTDLLEAAQAAREGLKMSQSMMEAGDHLEFNVSSGTPAMKSSFSILQAAGYAPESTVWQVRNPKEMGEGQKRVFATNVSVLRREFDLKVFRSQVENYDFDSACDLFKGSDIAGQFAEEELIDACLRAGKVWQRSKLDDFKNFLDAYLSPEQKIHYEQWFYPSYEEAYLAIVRRKQGSIVEAFFHSFRAFEGILASWGRQELHAHVEEKEGAIYLSDSIFTEREKFFATAKYTKDNKPDNDLAKLECKIKEHFAKQDPVRAGYLLDFPSLCKFFRSLREEYRQKCPSLRSLLTDEISRKRNTVVHQLRGLQEQDLYQSWNVESADCWESRILEYLNFISEQSFSSWDEVSLMASFHQTLISCIAEYQLI